MREGVGVKESRDRVSEGERMKGSTRAESNGAEVGHIISLSSLLLSVLCLL